MLVAGAYWYNDKHLSLCPSHLLPSAGFASAWGNWLFCSTTSSKNRSIWHRSVKGWVLNHKCWLVGGFNLSKKYCNHIVKMVSSSPIFGMNIENIFELPVATTQLRFDKFLMLDPPRILQLTAAVSIKGPDAFSCGTFWLALSLGPMAIRW